MMWFSIALIASMFVIGLATIDRLKWGESSLNTWVLMPLGIYSWMQSAIFTPWWIGFGIVSFVVSSKMAVELVVIFWLARASFEVVRPSMAAEKIVKNINQLRWVDGMGEDIYRMIHLLIVIVTTMLVWIM